MPFSPINDLDAVFGDCGHVLSLMNNIQAEKITCGVKSLIYANELLQSANNLNKQPQYTTKYVYSLSDEKVKLNSPSEDFKLKKNHRRKV